MKGTVLITGGARKLGRHIALALAEKGWDIALHYNNSLSQAEELAEKVADMERNCSLFRADLSNMNEVRQLMPAVMEECPDCSVLINNASVFERSSLVDTEEELFDRHFDVNFKAAFFLTVDFARAFSAAGVGRTGHVINMLDTCVAVANDAYSVYSLSKVALADFTIQAARQMAPAISVNGICPGIVTPAADGQPPVSDSFINSLPMKRSGTADDVAHAVTFLLESEFITGQLLYVDGGQHLLSKKTRV